MVSVKDKLKGGLDLMLLFGKGIKPFEKDPSKAAAIRSLWIPVILYPIVPLLAWFYPPIGMHDGDYPYSQIFVNVTVFYVLSFAVSAGMMRV